MLSSQPSGMVWLGVEETVDCGREDFEVASEDSGDSEDSEDDALDEDEVGDEDE